MQQAGTESLIIALLNGVSLTSLFKSIKQLRCDTQIRSLSFVVDNVKSTLKPNSTKFISEPNTVKFRSLVGPNPDFLWSIIPGWVSVQKIRT